MSTVIGMIEPVAGEIVEVFVLEQLGPHLSRIRERRGWALEFTQLIAVLGEHLARRVYPLIVAQHRRDQDDLRFVIRFSHAAKDLLGSFAIPPDRDVPRRSCHKRQ